MNTLTQLFDWLLPASLRASLLTLAVLLIQAALHRHLGARMRYALWLPVLVVLLMPVLPQSQWSIEHVFQTPPQPVQIVSAPITSTMEPTPVVFEAPTLMPEPFNWQRLLILTWASVSAVMLILGSLSFMLTLRRFKKVRHPASDELLATLSQIAREMQLRYVPRVLIASSVSSPAVTGLLRPTLLLPAEFDREFTPAEARLVLKHELMHLKRGDLPLNVLMCVLMALHWFNPLLWIAFFKIRADREAACDAQVLHNASDGHRVEYGHALLKVETAFCPRGFSLGFVGIFQRGSSLRSRIRSIATHRNPHPSMKVLITLCIVLMTFLGITRAQQPKPTESAPLIAIEIKIIKFKKATDWNFGGRLPAGEPAPFSASLLSPEELTVQLREALKDDSTNITSYPRMVTAEGKEVMIKSVVNQHSKEGNLPIGQVFKLTPSLHGAQIKLNIDLTDSELIDPATETVTSEFKEDEPTVRRRTYKATHESHDGNSWVIADWEDGKPQSKRPVLYIITPHVFDPKKGGLPVGLDFTTAIDTTAEAKTAPTTDFIKQKLEKLIIPHIQFQGATAAECLEYLRVKSRELDTMAPDPAARGVNILYKAGNPPSNAAISLDLKEIPLGEALRYVVELANLKMLVQPYAVLIGSADDSDFTKAAAAPPVLNPPDKLGEIVITAKKTSIDPSTEIQTAKGDARFQAWDTSIQAEELVFDRKAQQLKIHGPFTIISGGNQKRSSTSSESSAVLDLASDKLTTSGPHTTEILTPPASKIIIPSVEFRDATLTECIDFMRIKSRELDPDKKGVNIIVKPGGDASARITLSLKNVPLSEALRYCAELANHKLTSDAQSYFLTPVSAEAPANKDQASSPPAQPATRADEAKSAELRKASSKQYDFTRAKLGDVLQILTTDAGLNFFSLPPNDNPINQKLVTFSIRSSPFRVLETLCWANGLIVVFDHDLWSIRPANDSDQFMQIYFPPKTKAGIETLLKDISSVLGGSETKSTAYTPQPSVVFKENENSFYVKATRLQHTWVAAYFQGLSSSAQSGKTK